MAQDSRPEAPSVASVTMEHWRAMQLVAVLHRVQVLTGVARDLLDQLCREQGDGLNTYERSRLRELAEFLDIAQDRTADVAQIFSLVAQMRKKEDDVQRLQLEHRKEQQ